MSYIEGHDGRESSIYFWIPASAGMTKSLSTGLKQSFPWRGESSRSAFRLVGNEKMGKYISNEIR